MSRRIPKQIRITVENDRFLKQRARELGVSESEVVRQALVDASSSVRMIDHHSHTCDYRTTDASRTEPAFTDGESCG